MHFFYTIQTVQKCLETLKISESQQAFNSNVDHGSPDNSFS